MARDFLAVIKKVEGYYSKALGTATLNTVQQNQDESLRQALVGYANDSMKEVEKVQRWRKGRTSTTIVTAPLTSTYSFASNGWIYIRRIYWRFSTGRIVDLELYDANEPQLIFGDGPNAIPGAPQFYALGGTNGSQLQLFPTPDANGPDSGNYTLQVEYYQSLPQIIETVGTTVAANPSLTVPSTAYLVAAGGVAANPAGDFLTVRGAGNPTGLAGIGAFDDFTVAWSAFPGATTVTMGSGAITAVTNGQCFLYSTNWLIDNWPKVLTFAMCREVATYLKSTEQYTLWEARYQKELQGLMEWDEQSVHDVEVLAGSVGGQRQPLLRGIDWPDQWDVRGVVS